MLRGHKNGFAIVSVTKYIALRLVKAFYNNRDIIILSEFLFPRRGSKKSDEEFRFFIYTVLHEVAHAVRNHKSPSELTREDDIAQENEARNLAIKWFNERVQQPDKKYQPELTSEEVDRMVETRKNIESS